MFDDNQINGITYSLNPEENKDTEDNENNLNEKENNENLLNENINDLIPKILEKAVDILNDTGNKIQFFKKTLRQIDESQKNNSTSKNQSNNSENEKTNINDLKNFVDKKTISDLLKKEKEIYCNFVFLNKIFPTYTNIPEKLFNTRAFLEICFIDLVNSHSSILDMDISGQLILIQYKRYENKPIEFLISKKKYITPLLKISITMLDNSIISKGKNDIINLNEKLDNNDSIFDLKKYVKDLLNFIDNMINNNQLFDDTFKLSIMPGLISKITKLMQSRIKITSKMINNICSIQIKYINILFNNKDDKTKDNYIDKKKFCEFYEVFIFILFDKYKNKIIGVLLDTIIDMNTLYLKNIKSESNNLDFIGKQFFENIFYIINNQIFENINKSIPNNNAIYEKLDNFKSYDDFYITYINHNLFSIENKNEKIIQLINRIENSYIKKEFLKFNRNLIELLGTIKLIIHYLKIKSINNYNDLFSNLFLIFTKIIQLNKNKIFFEVINSYEFIFLNINQIICKENIIAEFFKTVINTYNNEYYLHLLFIFLSHLYKICPEIYFYFFDHCLNKAINSTKNFNSKLIKKKFTTFTQLNDNINELINSFILMEFLIFFQKEKKALNKKDIKKIISIIHFYYDLFIDTDNEESFSKAKINNIKLSLINLFLMNIAVFTIERSDNFIVEEKNILILLSMFNYSNNAKIMKYSSSLLILNINKDKDLKNFIKTNYTFLINSILNKIIYFNINNNSNKSLVNSSNDNCRHMKSVILSVFSSLIELINNFYYDDEINKIFVVEFYNYTEKLFPYFDNNIKDKNVHSIDIMLEIFIKISIFQNNVLSNECKKNGIDISLLDIDTIRMASEEFNHENNQKNKLIQSLKLLKEKLKLQKSNICRKLILRFIPLILSKKITFVSKCLQIIKNYLLMLFLLPMEKEEEENFSEEDPSNVVISSSLGPIMYELWKPLIFAFNSKSTTLAGFTMFFEIFNEISNFHWEFFDSDKIFGDLIPCLGEKLNAFSQDYKEIQIYNCVNNYVLVFLKKIFKHNKFNKKYKEDFQKFIEDNKKYFMIGCDEERKENINKDFNKMLFSFTKI